LGSTVYLAPEVRSDKKKEFDAIVDGLIFEFKNMRGIIPSAMQRKTVSLFYP
jgi:hypothetical protein